MENGTDWKLNQPMSLAFSIAFQEYTDLRCVRKRFRDISGKPPGLKMKMMKIGFTLETLEKEKKKNKNKKVEFIGNF